MTPLILRSSIVPRRGGVADPATVPPPRWAPPTPGPQRGLPVEAPTLESVTHQLITTCYLSGANVPQERSQVAEANRRGAGGRVRARGKRALGEGTGRLEPRASHAAAHPREGRQSSVGGPLR